MLLLLLHVPEVEVMVVDVVAEPVVAEGRDGPRDGHGREAGRGSGVLAEQHGGSAFDVLMR